jgi:thiamine-phosphate pyrophosphorylase
MKVIGKLCVITDTSVQNRYTHTELTEMAARGRADMIQFREKNISTSGMIDTACEMRRICRKFGVKFIVNDRTDIAMVSDADGVHLGQTDISAKDARTLLGKSAIIGRTAHSLKEAKQAERDGADYVGFGQIFRTSSKPKTDSPKGIEELRKVCRLVNIPVFAIGGIDISNARSVIDAGAHGIAVIGAVVKSNHPYSAVKQLKLCVLAA